MKSLAGGDALQDCLPETLDFEHPAQSRTRGPARLLSNDNRWTRLGVPMALTSMTLSYITKNFSSFIYLIVAGLLFGYSSLSFVILKFEFPH